MAPDPIADAELDVKRAIAGKMRQGVLTAAEVEQAELELRKTEAEIKSEEIKAQRRETAGLGGQAGLMEWLRDEIKDSRAAAAAAMERADEAQAAMIGQRIGMLEQSLANAQRPVEPPVDPLDQLIAYREKLDKLRDVFFPGYGLPVAAPAGPDPALLEYQKAKQALEFEKWKLELEQRKELRLTELSLQQRKQDRELELLERHYQNIDRFMNGTAPQITSVVQSIAQAILDSKGVAAPVGVAAAAAPQARPQSADPEMKQELCPVEGCGTLINYKDSWAQVVCPGCHSVLPVNADAVPPAGEEPTPIARGQAARRASMRVPQHVAAVGGSRAMAWSRLAEEEA